MTAPPRHLPGGQPELLEHIDHLVPQLPLALFLCNMPSSPGACSTWPASTRVGSLKAFRR